MKLCISTEKVIMMGYRGRYPGNGPFRDLPPWQRPGWAYGYRSGYGLGYGRGYYTGDPTKCVRFPWLPRWWWTNPDYSGVTPQAPIPGQTPVAPDEETFLKEQMKYMEQELEALKKRLGELGSKENQ